MPLGRDVMSCDITMRNESSTDRGIMLSRKDTALACTPPDEWHHVDAGLRAMIRALAAIPPSHEVVTFIHDYRECKTNGDDREASEILLDFAKWLRRACRDLT